MKTEQPVRVTTLCYRCRCDYISAGYLLTFVGNTIKSECDICLVRMGFDYYLEDEDVNKAMQ